MTSLPTTSTAVAGDLLKLTPAALVQQHHLPTTTCATNLDLVLGQAIRDAVLKDAVAKQATAAASFLLAAQQQGGGGVHMMNTTTPSNNDAVTKDLARLAVASALDVLLPTHGRGR